jgi:hypothetical protein
MDQFDWEKAKEGHSTVTYEFLREWHDKDISEEEFVRQYSSLSREGKLHAGVMRAPSAARHTYRHLQKKFGFFKTR